MTDPRTRRARLWQAAEARKIPLRAILATVGVVVLVYLAAQLVDRLRGVLLLLVVAGFIALLLNPLVVVVTRVLRRRGLAVAVVTLVAVVAFGGLATAFGYPLINGMTHLAADLPADVHRIQHGQGWLGRLVQRYHLQTWVEHNAPKLVGYARDLGKPALSLGKGAVSLIFSLLTVFVLVVLMLLEAPKLRTGLLRLMAPARARRYTAIAAEVTREVTGFMLGDLATSIIAGAVVLLALLVLGVPFPFLWALWVALVDFLPMIGGALAGIPVVLFAFTHSLTAGIVTLVVFLVYTQVENHVLNPLIMSRTVRINPLLVLVSILVGASIGSWVGGLFGGFVAALLAIPVAGAIQVIVSEIWRSTAEPSAVAGQQGTKPAPAGGSGDPSAGAEAGALQVIVQEVWQSTAMSASEAAQRGPGSAPAAE
ncbi:MAG TPA: AI-2E family transporter [Streptosporangiaceae bacterium]|nr:AI-2E family transporter [Streptosporangiaceae bacterium]